MKNIFCKKIAAAEPYNAGLTVPPERVFKDILFLFWGLLLLTGCGLGANKRSTEMNRGGQETEIAASEVFVPATSPYVDENNPDPNLIYMAYADQFGNTACIVGGISLGGRKPLTISVETINGERHLLRSLHLREQASVTYSGAGNLENLLDWVVENRAAKQYIELTEAAESLPEIVSSDIVRFHSARMPQDLAQMLRSIPAGNGQNYYELLLAEDADIILCPNLTRRYSGMAVRYGEKTVLLNTYFDEHNGFTLNVEWASVAVHEISGHLGLYRKVEQNEVSAIYANYVETDELYAYIVQLEFLLAAESAGYPAAVMLHNVERTLERGFSTIGLPVTADKSADNKFFLDLIPLKKQ
jgi:hypothetical protein